MNLEKVGFLEQREQRKQLEGSCCLGEEWVGMLTGPQTLPPV